MKRIILAIMLAVPVLCAGQLRGSRQDNRSANTQFQKFSQFYQYLNATYIDTVDNTRLVEKAIVDILAELDPHSAYLSPEEMTGMTETMEGRFSGIGVTISMLNDTLTVVGLISGGPSEKVGVMPDDRIVSVDGTPTVGMKQNDIIKMLRGPKGSEVIVSMVRHSEKEPINFRIIRDDIPIHTVDAAYLIEPGTGYIRVNRFAQNTMQEFSRAFVEMGRPGSLILDLRGNGGGLLPQALDMANFFLPQGAVLLSTEGRAGLEDSYNAPRNGAYLEGKVVVLIDDLSASASEIVSGAIQDWDRGVIVGHRSFGKGLVQRQFPLIDGSAVNITVSRYLTPTGRAIQRPYEKGNTTQYYQDLNERYSQGEDSNTGSDSLTYRTLRLGKTVYGGGGIFPDYYVPTDTTGYTSYFRQLYRKNVIHEFSTRYISIHRAELSERYPTFESFADNFTVSDAVIEELNDLAGRRDVTFTPEEVNTSRELVKDRLMVLFVQNMFGQERAHEYGNRNDPTVQRGLEVIRNWETQAAGIALDKI